MHIAPGARFRRYEVTRPLGAGGMGEVYLARDVELERTVALKILPQSRTASEESIRRFAREAKAACALNHPNVAHVYDAGAEGDVRFIAMEYVEGETLRNRLARQPLTLEQALDYAVQVCAALASAHAAGVVHRDVKPENIVVRPDGYVKVLDFGLAKLTGASEPDLMITQPGVVMGTTAYISPEQLRGAEADARSDVFSLGVILYEMIAGRRPFGGDSQSSTFSAILTEEPAALPAISDSSAPLVQRIVKKALAKNPDQRYPSAAAMLEDLKHALHGARAEAIRSGDVPTEVMALPQPRAKTTIAIAAAILIIAVAAGVWFATRPKTQPTTSPAAQQAGPIKPLTIRTTPPGARVYLQRFTGRDEAPRELAGTTPLTAQVPAGDYLVTIEHDGYEPVMRPVSLAAVDIGGMMIERPAPQWNLTLRRPGEVPPRMVAIDGGNYRLAGSTRPTERMIPLAPFLIDRYEVTNAEFAEFVRDGGYRRAELWREPFIDGGRTLTFAEAMARFRDTTGLPGPRNWAAGRFPTGQQDFPVTHVTWYEAKAYAAYRGKDLPTLYEWDKAARNGESVFFGIKWPWGVVAEGTNVGLRANFRGNGPMRVDALPFGMSESGVFNLAGNVAEWCRNAYDNDVLALGGGYDDPTYGFVNLAGFPRFYSSPNLGFRCVKETAPGAGQGAFAMHRNVEVPDFKPVSDAEYAAIARQFDYQPAPLNARVTETKDADDWTRETIAFDGAPGRRAALVLYLPKRFRRPLQVIAYCPPSDVVRGFNPLPDNMDIVMAPFVRSGRAVFSVLLPGYIGRERPNHAPQPPRNTPEFLDEAIANVIENRRAVDYLATRNDIDVSRLGFFGPSAGSFLGTLVTALEPRFKAVVLMGAGVSRNDVTSDPAANRVNFVNHIAAPKLVIQGRYDEAAPLKTQTEPMFRLMREPKKLYVFEGGHVPPQSLMVPVMNGFYDQTLGPVKQ